MRSYRNGATRYHYDNFLKSFAKFVDCFRNDFAVAFVAQIQKLDKKLECLSITPLHLKMALF